MDFFREMFEMITPKLDRDRLYSVLPIHLHGDAHRLEYQAKQDESLSGDEAEACTLYLLSIWILDLAGKGTAPLRPSDAHLIHRIMRRQDEKVPWGRRRDEMHRVAQAVFRQISN